MRGFISLILNPFLMVLVFLKVIHTPKTPVKRVFSSNPKINFPHSNSYKIVIRSFHKLIIKIDNVLEVL